MRKIRIEYIAEKKKNIGGYLIPEVIEIPKNRLEELKEKYLPEFMKKIWFVKYKEIPLRKRFIETVLLMSDIKIRERKVIKGGDINGKITQSNI